MKKRIPIIVLSVLLIVAIGWGVIVTGVAITGVKENQKFSANNEELIEQNKRLLSQLSEAVTETPAILIAIGGMINERATTKAIDDDIVIIVAPHYDGIIDKVKETAWAIPNALKQAKYKTCIIMVVDGKNDCQLGWTIHSDGDSTVFVGE